MIERTRTDSVNYSSPRQSVSTGRTIEVAAEATDAISPLEIGDLLRIFYERRYVIISAAVLGLLAGIVVSMLMTPLYRATAMLELNADASQDLVTARGEKSDRGGQQAVATQVGLLKSDALARRVAQDLNLVSDGDYGGEAQDRQVRLDNAAATIQSNTIVDSSPESMLISVSYSSPDPVLAAKVANALTRGFIESSLDRNYEASSYARDFLSDQIGKTKKALETSERDLNNYAIEAGIFRGPSQVSNGVVTEGASLSIASLDALNNALTEAQVKRIAAEEAYRAGAAGQGSAANESTAGLRQQKAEVEADYQEKLALFRPEYPEMQELRRKISSLDQAIAGERSRTVGGKKADLWANYEAAIASEQAIAARVSALKSEAQGERAASVQYNILLREVDQNRALYDALLQRYKEIGVTGGIGRSNVSLVDSAQPPRVPYRPNLALNSGLGLAAGLALGVFIAVLANLLLNNIVIASDVRNKLGRPVLGVIPDAQGDATMFDQLEDRKSDVSEAYFSVRSALRFADPDGEPKSILITSTRPGEGKSTTAYAIAMNAAREGRRTLLIDADLRKPTFLSRQSSNRGFAHLLQSDDSLSTYVEDTKVPNLSLLPVGRYTGSAAELLASARLGHIAGDAARDYDFVVFDGPPVLGLSDAPLLGATAERTIVVIESRRSRTSHVHEMLGRLEAAGARILGVILTRVRPDAAGYGYYGYYSYRYGDGDTGGRVSSDAARTLDVAVNS